MLSTCQRLVMRAAIGLTMCRCQSARYSRGTLFWRGMGLLIGG
jgi:hypothetical protein